MVRSLCGSMISESLCRSGMVGGGEAHISLVVPTLSKSLLIVTLAVADPGEGTRGIPYFGIKKMAEGRKASRTRDPLPPHLGQGLDSPLVSESSDKISPALS